MVNLPLVARIRARIDRWDAESAERGESMPARDIYDDCPACTGHFAAPLRYDIRSMALMPPLTHDKIHEALDHRLIAGAILGAGAGSSLVLGVVLLING